MIFALILVFSVVSAGCTGQDQPSQENGDDDQNGEQKETTIGVQGTRSEIMVYWDPSDGFSNEIIGMHNMYETLLRYHPLEDEFDPVLAKDWSKSEDGLTWTFELREGVKFHTGGEMTAEDVKYSINRTMTRGKGAAFIWSPVESIEVVDDYTVKFHLNSPAPIDLIAASSYGSYIFSKEQGQNVDNLHEWFNEPNDAGTGPYTVQSWDQGDKLVLTKFDDYWQGWDSDKNKFEKVVIQNVPEATTARQMLGKGNLDYVERLPYTELQAAQENPGVELVDTKSFQNLIGFFNTEKAPFDDMKMRKAISYLVPYQTIVNEVLHGNAIQGRGPVPHGMWGHSNEIKQYEYDLEKAKSLIKESKYSMEELKDKELLATYTSGNVMQKESLLLLQSRLSELNISLEVRGMPWQQQWSKAKSTVPEERQDLFLMYWWPDLASPSTYLTNLYYSEDKPYFNMAYYDNGTVDEKIDEAKRVAGLNRTKAAEIYKDAQEIIVNDAPTIFFYDKKYVRSVRTSLGGYEDNPAYPHVVRWYNCYKKESN